MYISLKSILFPSVSPNLKNVVYRAGIHHSSDAEWEMVYQKYNNSLIPSEKVKLMVALAATRDGARLLRFVILLQIIYV